MTTGADENSLFVFRGYRLDARQRRLQGPNDESVMLRPKEFDALLVLVQRAGSPVSKDELMSTVWPDTVVEENNLNQVVSKLRQVFGDDRSNPEFIATITGRGYQFVAEVETPGTVKPTVRKPARVHDWRYAVAALVVAAVAVIAVLLSRGGNAPEGPVRAGLSDAVLVTASAAANSMPSLSPDGRLMVFVSDRSGTNQLWIKGVPDGNAIALTEGPLPANSPSWSPVGDTILFERPAPDGVPSVWAIDALGSRAPRLVVRNAVNPKFSTDGQSFAFTRGHGEIHIGYLDGGQSRRLEGVPETPGFAKPMPAVNANGDIAFVLADEGPSGNLWFYEAATGQFRQLTQSSGEFAGVWAGNPIWLPDNRTIVYTASTEVPANVHLWRIDTQSPVPVRLSTGVGGYTEPAVSRDGSVLVYTYAQPLWRLVQTDPTTGDQRTIYESRKTLALPTLSADGRTIVVFGENVFTLPVVGGEATQLTFGAPGQATLPAWSRSGNIIYYYRERSLHRIDPETGEDETVLQDFHWSTQNWVAAHGQTLAYRIKSRWPGRARSVVHDLGSGEIRELDDEILPTEWSRDGTVLLGRRAGDYALLLCAAQTLSCKPIMESEAPVDGAMPRWSHDEARVFFRRALPDKPGYAEIWVVSRHGGEPERLFELGPYEPLSFFFDVASDDSVIWNQYDSHGSPEIWMTRDLGGAAAGR